jgi:UDP-2,3-diacylglucosamine pyrophosphatase LpxH
MTSRLPLGLVVVACAALHVWPPDTLRAQGASRTVVVVSDLHMGAGRDTRGAWRAGEDFRWPKEFADFLDAVDQSGKSAVDLVLNGDTFDLLDPALPACPSPDLRAGCSEADAQKRLDVVLAAHDGAIKALGAFSRRGTNRVAFVPGDHDAALLFPGVERRLTAWLGGSSGRVGIAKAGHWTSADGQIVAEHGHQIGTAHAFSKWPAPFVRHAGRDYLEKTSGEALVGPLFDRLEVSYPIVDNIAAVGTGLKYALGAENADLGDATAPLLRYLLLNMSWTQFRMELDDGEVKAPVWNLAPVRAQGATFLVSSLADDDRFKAIAAKALADGRLASLPPLTDEQLTALCNYRAAVRRARRRFEPFLSQLDPRGPVVAECPRTPESRGAVFDYFWQSRDEVFQRHIQTVAGQPRSSSAPPLGVLVHGHTHLPDRAQATANMISGGLLKIPLEGFSPVRGALTPVAINGGAWQRTVTPVQFERLAVQRKVAEKELLVSLQPEELAPCFSFVRIEPYAATPAPAVRYWRVGANGWEIAGSCQP